MDAISVFQVVAVLSVLYFIIRDDYKNDPRNPLNVAQVYQAQRNSQRDADSGIGPFEGRELLEPEDDDGYELFGEGFDAEVPRRGTYAEEADREPYRDSQRGVLPQDVSNMAGPGWHYCTTDNIGAWKNDPNCTHGRYPVPSVNTADIKPNVRNTQAGS